MRTALSFFAFFRIFAGNEGGLWPKRTKKDERNQNACWVRPHRSFLAVSLSFRLFLRRPNPLFVLCGKPNGFSRKRRKGSKEIKTSQASCLNQPRPSSISSCRGLSPFGCSSARQTLFVSFRSLRQIKWGLAEKSEKDRRNQDVPGELTKPATSLIHHFVPWSFFRVFLRRPNPLFVSFRSLRQTKWG